MGEYSMPILARCAPSSSPQRKSALATISEQMVRRGALALTKMDLTWATYEEISLGVLQAALAGPSEKRAQQRDPGSPVASLNPAQR